uniref:hypothetical protein n=1 Tax=Acinetobacter colistiniresistens TaxID=280145 RepID=UPI001C0720F7
QDRDGETQDRLKLSKSCQRKQAPYKALVFYKEFWWRWRESNPQTPNTITLYQVESLKIKGFTLAIFDRFGLYSI